MSHRWIIKGKGSHDTQMKHKPQGKSIVYRVGHQGLDHTASATSRLVEELDQREAIEVPEQ